jgi:hypothetical protein
MSQAYRWFRPSRGPSRRPWAHALGALMLPLLVATNVACTSRQELAAQLRVATGQDQIPKVVACWESAFEAAGFTGEYLAVLDFTVSAGTGQVRNAIVQELYDTSTGEPEPAEEMGHELSDCLVEALNDSSFGPSGMSPRGDVHVRGFRLAFTDASQKARAAASEHSPTVLIGPRANRCKGLYGHEPPRDAARLHQELADAQAEAARADGAERSRKARALQRSYDLTLELTARLKLDTHRDDLSDAGRERLFEELERARRLTADLGPKIGCQPPSD